MPSAALVSAIVTTRDSAETLERLLESVVAQEYEPIELIVVDNASSDSTMAIARRFTDVAFDRGPERSAQRNAGVARASGDYVLILDADMILEPQTVGECVAAALEAAAVAVVVPETTVGPGLLAAIRKLERSCYEGDPTIEAARFFDRAAFVRCGGYDEDLSGPEDWDLPARMRRAGETIARANSARILHDETGLTLRAHLGKKFYYGKSLSIYARRHPKLAARQFNLFRPAFVNNWRRLARQPVLAAGVFALKTAEFTAGAAGAVAARRSR
jgi:glycosyltransferase involved in cell wall biosynthesis